MTPLGRSRKARRELMTDTLPPLQLSPLDDCAGAESFHKLDLVPFVAQIEAPIVACPFPPVTESPRKLQVLSEIAADLGVDLLNPLTQGPLFCFLDNVAAETAGGGGSLAFGTLVVDEQWRVNRPIMLPPGFTLAGVGVGGAGAIIVVRGFEGAAAVVLREDAGPARRVVIRDLRIETDAFLADVLPSGQSMVVAGIKFSGAENSYIKDVLVANFGVGLFCSRAISNWVSNCTFFGNGHNIVFFRGNFNNHVRDCFIRFAKCWGVRCFGAADGPDPFEGLLEANGWGNDFQFDGCDIEQNGLGGILANGFETRISGCRFEGNGQAANTAILSIPLPINILIQLGPSPTGFTGPAGTFEDSGEVKILGNVIAGSQIIATFPSQLSAHTPEKAWPGGYGVRARFNMGNTAPGGANKIVVAGVA